MMLKKPIKMIITTTVYVTVSKTQRGCSLLSSNANTVLRAML